MLLGLVAWDVKLKILLTGAAGFTGAFFAKWVKAAGHAVVPLACDLTDKQAVMEEVKQHQFNAVVHLAAISFVAHEDEAALYAVNVVGTTNLLDALSALSAKPSRVLLASSANVYGNCTESPIAETQAPAPVNHYATSKFAMECMAGQYVDRLPIVISRPFNYTGPGQAAQFLIPKLVACFAHKEVTVELGNLMVQREFNDVRMVCDAYLALLEKGSTGEVYNVCSGRTYTLMDVLQLLEKVSGHHVTVRVNPAFIRTNEVHRLHGDPTKLLACTGPLQSHSLEDTLRWMLQGALV